MTANVQAIVILISILIPTIFLVVFLMFYFKRLAREKLAEFNNLPEVAVNIKIVAKNIIVREETRQISENHFETVEINFCNLSFETDDSVQLSFDVSTELYDAVAEGDTGTLIYKEDNGNRYFVNFRRIN